jgi:RimJ/RimL family protein N-acetyltransferase
MAWIAGKRVVLRAWERDDVRTRWESDQTADATEARMRHWHEPPRSLQQREAEFDAEVAEPDASAISLVIEVDGRAIGDVNFFHIDTRNRNAEVGLSIWRADDWGHGYGSDALEAMLRWGFRQLNLHRVELAVDPTNERALHVYEKLGFVAEGRRREAHFDDGSFGDEIVMGLLNREFEARDRVPASTRQHGTPRPPEHATA